MDYERFILDDERLIKLPTAARFIYLEVVRISIPGAVEVFIDGFDDGAKGQIDIRPSNVHGRVELMFGEDGQLADVTWDDER